MAEAALRPGLFGETASASTACRAIVESGAVRGSLGREMPARDHLHEHVRAALIRDGWTITHDPLRLRWGKKDVYVDLGAERFLGAQRGELRIAVEVKSFTGPSPIDALERALGQFTLYGDVLARVEPERELYLAVSDTTYSDVFEDSMGQLLLANGRLKLLVFSVETEIIQRWTPEPPTAK